MIRSSRVLWFSLLFSLAGGALAEDAGTAAISTLGRLNGVALACKQPALTARVREAIISAAPKTRESGETFERATNDAYLAQLEAGGTCPDAKTLNSQIDAGEAALKQAYRPAS